MRTTLRNLLAQQKKGIVKRGLVAEYRFNDWRNLLKWSEDFSNAAWTKTDVTLGDQITASNGVILTKLTETATTTGHGISQSLTLSDNTDYIAYGIFKDGTRRWVRIQGQDKANVQHIAWFDLQNGVIGTVTVGDTGSIVDLGSGAYLCTLKFNSASGATSPLFYIRMNQTDNQNAAYLGDISKNVYCGGFHLQLASVANQSYQRTTDGQSLWNSKREWMYPANLETNGSFETDTNADGLADGWTAVGSPTLTLDADCVYGTKAQKIVAASNADYIYKQINSLLVNGRSYYVAISGKLVSGSGARFKIGTTQNGSDIVSQSITSSGWAREGNEYIFTYSGGNVFVNTAGTGAANTIILDGLLILDLTIFGTAPTRQQCNEIFPIWFNGTATMELPKYNGYLGSTVAADANDPTPDGVGLSFDGGDYVGGMNWGTIKSLVWVFYNTNTQSAVATVEVPIEFQNASSYYLSLGPVTSNLTNEIITITTTAGGYCGWCDASATIVPGYHLIELVWDGSKYQIYLDGIAKPTTVYGTPLLIPASAVRLGLLNAGTAGYYGKMDYLLPYSESLTQKERKQNIREIKRQLAERGLQVSW